MKTILHPANTRGHANHGWLNTHHTFSFANYYDPERVHFGTLRVLNDDIIAAGTGFGTHPHDNMEIITIPIDGALEHKDSMGNHGVIRQGEVQVMSAGTGIYHSEYNHNKDAEGKFLQIWVFPNKKNVTPRYDQIVLDTSKMQNQLMQILSPYPEDEGVWIHQNAWFYMGNFDKGHKETYQFNDPANGLYVFVIKGEAKIANQELKERDGIGILEIDMLNIEALSNTELLLMEIPMELNY